MDLVAAGAYRRTQAELDDPYRSWVRTDRAFFAAGACHILAWACREAHRTRSIRVASLRAAHGTQVFHTYACWSGWAFDHCGWHPEDALISVNEQFEGYSLERVGIGVELGRFCREQHHRLPHQFHADPMPRAREYVGRFEPPWSSGPGDT